MFIKCWDARDHARDVELTVLDSDNPKPAQGTDVAGRPNARQFVLLESIKRDSDHATTVILRLQHEAEVTYLSDARGQPAADVFLAVMPLKFQTASGHQ